MEVEYDITDKIIKIFNDVKANHRLSKYNTYDTILIDMQEGGDKLYHGSAYDIRCTKPNIICEVRGDLVTKRELENETKIKIEQLNCKIRGIHRHPESILYQIGTPKNQTSHLHFVCKDKTASATMRIVNFIKDF